MEQEYYEGYEVSDIDVREHTDGSYYIGREINIDGNWHPYSIESQKFKQMDQAIKQYAAMKTNQIGKQVGERLGSREYKPLPETKPIYYKHPHHMDKHGTLPIIDIERSREATHKHEFEHDFERSQELYVVRRGTSDELKPIRTTQELREELIKEVEINREIDLTGWNPEDYTRKEIQEFDKGYDQKIERIQDSDLAELKEYMKEHHISLSNVHPDKLSGNDFAIENNPVFRDIDKLELPPEREGFQLSKNQDQPERQDLIRELDEELERLDEFIELSEMVQTKEITLDR